MDQGRLPIDVCERVIDMITTGSHHSRTFYPLYLNDLCACALTCSDWLPRSRLNLYRQVRIRERNDLDRFSETILVDQPFLANLVQELVLGHPPEKKERTGYVPFAEIALVHALRNVRVLTLSNFNWHALHHQYHREAAQYPVVELNIIGGSFNALPDLLRVIWAFQQLRSLTLIDVEVGNRSRDLEWITQEVSAYAVLDTGPRGVGGLVVGDRGQNIFCPRCSRKVRPSPIKAIWDPAMGA